MIFLISDLHLSPRSPGATRLFLSFLAGRARQAEALYILGDLFEVWVGDDIDDPYAAQITAAIVGAILVVINAALTNVPVELAPIVNQVFVLVVVVLGSFGAYKVIKG